jgi:hypothetical protein
METIMQKELSTLIEKAARTEMTSDQIREQRQSFVYGNTHIENSDITRDMVIAADRKVQLMIEAKDANER